MNEPIGENGAVDPSRIATVDELAAQLRRLRVRAGNPALREIERQSQRHGQSLPRSTLATVFAGHRAPRRHVLVTLLKTLGVADWEVQRWVTGWEQTIEHSAAPSTGSHHGMQSARAEIRPTQVVGRPVDENGANGSVWRFSEEYPVTLVCSRISSTAQPQVPYTHPSHPDYVELLSYGDPDALLHLYGHVRAVNPQLEVRFSTTKGLRADDYETHLAILGGTDFNMLTRHMLSSPQLPVQMPLRLPESDWSAIEVQSNNERLRFSPVFEEIDGVPVLREDVLLFFRGPNPFNAQCTVTICAGIFARGTVAAVRCLTDPILGPANEAYLRSRFGDRRHFGFIARAFIVDGVVIPPDLNVPDSRLYEWSVPS